MKLFSVMICLAFLSQVFGEPGIKVRLNPTGINFILDLVQSMPIEFSYDDLSIQNNKFGNIFIQRTTFRELNAIDLDLGEVSIARLDEDTIRFSGDNSVANVEGKYDLLIEISKATHINTTGDLYVQYDGATTIDVDLAFAENGLVSVSVARCDTEVTNTEIFDNSVFETEEIRSIVQTLVRDELGRDISSQVCDRYIQGLSMYINQIIVGVTPQLALTPAVQTNLSFYSLPQAVENRSLEVELSGFSYPTHDPNIQYPYTQPMLPQFSTSSVMTQIALSDYTVKTLIHSLVVANVTTGLSVDLSSFQIGPIRFTPQVLSLIIPNITTFLNGRNLVLELSIPTVPTIDFTASLLSSSVEIHFSFIAFNATDNSRDLISTLKADISSSGNVSFTNNRIFPYFTSLEVALSVVESPAGSVNLQFINFFLTPASINTVILPTVNRLLSNGFEIPPLFGYDFHNPDVTIVDRAVLLSFDLVATGRESSSTGISIGPDDIQNAIGNLSDLSNLGVMQ